MHAVVLASTCTDQKVKVLSQDSIINFDMQAHAQTI